MRSAVDQTRSAMKIEAFWHDRAQGASQRILVGACLAFDELGYHGASTRIIAQRAEMSPAAVYIHFASKEELFFRIALDGHRVAFEALESAVSLSTDPAEKLRLAIATYSSFHAEWQVIAHSVHSDLRILTPDHWEQVVAIRKMTEDVFDDILNAGVASGQFSISDRSGTRTLLMSVCIDITRWYIDGGSRTPSSIGLQYSELASKLVSA